jgi:integron integrase
MSTLPNNKPKLLDQVRDKIRLKHYSWATEKTYVDWIRRFILFHDKQHPSEMGSLEVEAFLSHLASERNVAASTQNQALSALLFLYTEVLQQPIGYIEVDWAKRPEKLPEVLNRHEVKKVLSFLDGVPLLIVQLLYGSGLRLREAISLRVKDVDFAQQLIIVRDGKGQKDRTVPLPDAVSETLSEQLATVRQIHYNDLQNGNGRVPLPNALAVKYPNADREWPWQFVFPSKTLSHNPQDADSPLYRFHLHPSTIQKAVRQAGKTADLDKRVNPHIFRHSFATHLLENGYNIRTIQQLMGHKDVRTTMIYTHVVQRPSTIRSPLDQL